MYETLKIVNGHRIYRMKGTQRFYYAEICKGVNAIFKTIKAATAYCETL